MVVFNLSDNCKSVNCVIYKINFFFFSFPFLKKKRNLIIIWNLITISYDWFGFYNYSIDCIRCRGIQIYIKFIWYIKALFGEYKLKSELQNLLDQPIDSIYKIYYIIKNNKKILRQILLNSVKFKSFNFLQFLQYYS